MAGRGESSKKSFRKFARVRVSLRVLMKLKLQGGELMAVAATRNLGHGGVCLQVDEHVEEIAESLKGREPDLHLAITLQENPSPMGGSVKTTWIPCKVKWIVTPARDGTSLVAGLEFDQNERINIEKVDRFIEDYIRSKKEAIYRVS